VSYIYLMQDEWESASREWSRWVQPITVRHPENILYTCPIECQKAENIYTLHVTNRMPGRCEYSQRVDIFSQAMQDEWESASREWSKWVQPITARHPEDCPVSTFTQQVYLLFGSHVY
jgi:hypothetical protein